MGRNKAVSSPPPAPRRRRLWLLVAGLALLAALAWAAVSWQRQRAAEATAAAAVPATPDLTGWPAELGHRIAAVERRVREGDEAVAALAELSRLYHANGFFAEARQCYAVLEQLQPAEPRWMHRHATILAGYGEAAPAVERWRRVIDLAGDYLPARLRLADLLLKLNEREEAARLYQEVLEAAPGESYARLGLARLDVEAGRWREAREKLERIVQETNFNLGYDLIVTVYERLGLPERAAAIRGRQMASGAYRDFPDPWMEELWADSYDLYQLSLAAGVAHRVGESGTAVRLLERALSFAPDNASLHFQLGTTHAGSREPRKAVQHLRRATEINPAFSDAWVHLSNVLQTLGDAAGSDQALAAGLARNPDSYGLHQTRARRLRQAGRNAEALREYAIAAQLRPNTVEPFLEAALLHFQLGQGDEGVAALRQALVAEPEHPMALATLAMHGITSDDESAARHWLDRAEAQPRVPREQLQELRRRFRQQFGTGAN